MTIHVAVAEKSGNEFHYSRGGKSQCNTLSITNLTMFGRLQEKIKKILNLKPYFHVFVIEDNIGAVRELLRKFNYKFTDVQLTNQERTLLFDKVEVNLCSYSGKKLWKAYKLFQCLEGFSYVEFEYYLLADDYPDGYFGSELLELSRLTDKKIYYMWEQHVDFGFEVYMNGHRINSVVADTHGPAIKVDGRDEKIPKRDFGLVVSYNYTKVIDENSGIPKQIRESIKNLEKLPFEYLIFIKKEIPNFNSLINKITGE